MLETNKTRQKRLSIAVALTTIFVVVGGGAAYAYWSTTGIGVAAAPAGTSTAFTVTSTTATGGPLTPGGPTETIAFTVHNPSTGVQMLNSVAASVAASDGSTWSAVSGCSFADFTVGTPVFTQATISASGSSSGTVTVTMKDTGTVQDGCKNASVPIYFLAN